MCRCANFRCADDVVLGLLQASPLHCHLIYETEYKAVTGALAKPVYYAKADDLHCDSIG
jgi:hypothetical protein